MRFLIGIQSGCLIQSDDAFEALERMVMNARPIVAQRNCTIDSMTPEDFADHLDGKIQALIGSLEQCEVAQMLGNAATDRRLVVGFMKHYLVEVFAFAPHVTEATFMAIGRLPKDRADLMRPMILHDLEEVDHGEMALQDYLTLGGEEQFARTRRITPAGFALAATCRMLAERESPFAYLGYMYLLEALTPILAARAQQVMSARGFPKCARHFIDCHAAVDVFHARNLRDLIVRVARDYPDAAAAIEYGFDCFAGVYPLPIWNAALERARQELEQSSE